MEILPEDHNPGLSRLINYQNLTGDSAAEIILPVLNRAYRLANGWTIHGPGDLSLGAP